MDTYLYYVIGLWYSWFFTCLSFFMKSQLSRKSSEKITQNIVEKFHGGFKALKLKMSPYLKEQPRSIEVLNLLAKKRFDLSPLPQAALTNVLYRTRANLNPLGQEILTDSKELLWLKDAPNVLTANSLAEARDCVGLLLTETPGTIGYITGGLEGIHLQTILNGLTTEGISTFIIGIEESCYSKTKGRNPLYSTEEKMSLWTQLAPERSVLFVIPLRPDFVSPDDYYDWIAQYLGIFRNKQIVYLGSKDDPPEIILAHQRRAASPKHCLNISFGNPPVHTSELLDK